MSDRDRVFAAVSGAPLVLLGHSGSGGNAPNVANSSASLFLLLDQISHRKCTSQRCAGVPAVAALQRRFWEFWSSGIFGVLGVLGVIRLTCWSSCSCSDTSLTRHSRSHVIKWQFLTSNIQQHFQHPSHGVRTLRLPWQQERHPASSDIKGFFTPAVSDVPICSSCDLTGSQLPHRPGEGFHGFHG